MRKTTLNGRPCLIPVDDEGLELFGRLKHGRDVGCTIIQHRNPRHHRLFFALIRFIKMHAVNDETGQSLFEFASEKAIRGALMTALGRCLMIYDRANKRHIAIPDSISFAAMDQTEFNKFFDDAIALICNRWMPVGTMPQDVERELLEMVDGPHASTSERN